MVGRCTIKQKEARLTRGGDVALPLFFARITVAKRTMLVGQMAPPQTYRLQCMAAGLGAKASR